MSTELDQAFLDTALRWARMSKDPSTRVGAVLVVDKHIIGTGYNGFPSGIADTAERWNNRETKLELVVHAEMNAVLFAARHGIRTQGSTIYVAAYNPIDEDEVWGGPPCVRCTVELIQAGVVEYVSRPKKIAPSRWQESITRAEQLLHEKGLMYRSVPRMVDGSTVDWRPGAQ